MFLSCRDKQLDLSHPQVMGILNVTPDSRYGSHSYGHRDQLLYHAEAMVKEGAAIIDVGGESTRPGAQPVPLSEELDRVLPIIEALRTRVSAVISIDTRKTQVMLEAIASGVEMINDVNALQAEGALEAVANCKVAVCLMHMQGDPQTMQQNPQYEDVVTEVKDFLQQRIQAAVRAGISSDRIVIDPGFGFGKNLQHNLRLLKCLNQFKSLKQPILVGLSRKSMLETLLGLPVEERLHASIALATLAASQGALIIRVHDVRPTVEAMKIVTAIAEQEF